MQFPTKCLCFIQLFFNNMHFCLTKTEEMLLNWTSYLHCHNVHWHLRDFASAFSHKIIQSHFIYSTCLQWMLLGPFLSLCTIRYSSYVVTLQTFLLWHHQCILGNMKSCFVEHLHVGRWALALKQLNPYKTKGKNCLLVYVVLFSVDVTQRSLLLLLFLSCWAFQKHWKADSWRREKASCNRWPKEGLCPRQHLVSHTQVILTLCTIWHFCHWGCLNLNNKNKRHTQFDDIVKQCGIMTVACFIFKQLLLSIRISDMTYSRMGW